MTLSRVAISGAGVLCAVLLFIPIAELYDTNNYQATHIDPQSGLSVYTPNTSYYASGTCFANEVEINDIGFHGATVPAAKEPKVFRIVLVGGSYVEALQMPVAQMASTLLEQKLNTDPNRQFTYEVIPLGMHENSSLRNLIMYAEFGQQLKPDLVIVLETPYELVSNLEAPTIDGNGQIRLTLPYQKPTISTKVKDLARHFKLAVDLNGRFSIVQSNVLAFLQHPFFFVPQKQTSTVDNEKARWNIKEKILQTEQDIIAKDGARMVLATFIPTEASNVTDEMHQHFDALSKKYHIPYIELTEPIFSLGVTQHTSVELPCDMHWSQAGNNYVATILYEYLHQNPALLSHL